KILSMLLFRPGLLPSKIQLPEKPPSSSSMSAAFPLTGRVHFLYEKKHLIPAGSHLVSAHGMPPLRRRCPFRSRKYCIQPGSSQSSLLENPAFSYPPAPHPALQGSGLLLLRQIPGISNIPPQLHIQPPVPGSLREGIFLIDPGDGRSFLFPRDEDRSFVLQAAFYRKDLTYSQFLRHINVSAFR